MLSNLKSNTRADLRNMIWVVNYYSETVINYHPLSHDWSTTRRFARIANLADSESPRGKLQVLLGHRLLNKCQPQGRWATHSRSLRDRIARWKGRVSRVALRAECHGDGLLVSPWFMQSHWRLRAKVAVDASHSFRSHLVTTFNGI